MIVGPIEIFFGVGALFLLLYYHFTKNFDYWEKRHVVGPKPVPIFGNFKEIYLGQVHPADHLQRLHDDYPNEPAIGVFFNNSPALLVKDPDIIKDVLIKSFACFMDKGFTIHEDIDPLGQHLLFMAPKRWKSLRKKLTPVFTSGKLKEMFYLINECADNFNLCMEIKVAKGEPSECRELAAKFTTDVIGVCAFGLNMNALSDEESEFRKVGRSMFQDSWTNRARRIIRWMPYWLARLLKPIAYDEKVINFFLNMLKNTMEYRRKNDVRRHDFVDLLMDIKYHSEKSGEEKITDISLTAQAFVFFAAGFETSSTAICHAMYELALNLDVQKKLREEVKATYYQNNGKLTYDTIKDMKYLDKVLKETLRKYPPAYMLMRRSMEDHTFEGSNISITKGTRIIIPVHAIHYDPKNYLEPNKFDPERFDEQFANMRPQMSFLAFGDGPRNCIGERFAYYQIKMGLATAVRNFKFEVCEKTFTTYVKLRNSLLLAPKDGLYLKISKI